MNSTSPWKDVQIVFADGSIGPAKGAYTLGGWVDVVAQREHGTARFWVRDDGTADPPLNPCRLLHPWVHEPSEPLVTEVLPEPPPPTPISQAWEEVQKAIDGVVAVAGTLGPCEFERATTRLLGTLTKHKTVFESAALSHQPQPFEKIEEFEPDNRVTEEELTEVEQSTEGDFDLRAEMAPRLAAEVRILRRGRRRAGKLLIREIGASGPESVENTADRAAAEIRRLRAELAARPAPVPQEPDTKGETVTTSEEQRGLYRKFSVSRTDGSSRPGGKHAECDYFVLDWNHDPFALPAMRSYAAFCEDQYPELAANIRARIESAEKVHGDTIARTRADLMTLVAGIPPAVMDEAEKEARAEIATTPVLKCDVCKFVYQDVRAKAGDLCPFRDGGILLDVIRKVPFLSTSAEVALIPCECGHDPRAHWSDHCSTTVVNGMCSCPRYRPNTPIPPVVVEEAQRLDAWPPRDVVTKLVEAADRLKALDHDADGWEQIEEASRAAKAFLTKSDKEQPVHASVPVTPELAEVKRWIEQNVRPYEVLNRLPILSFSQLELAVLGVAHHRHDNPMLFETDYPPCLLDAFREIQAKPFDASPSETLEALRRADKVYFRKAHPVRCNQWFLPDGVQATEIQCIHTMDHKSPCRFRMHGRLYDMIQSGRPTVAGGDGTGVSLLQEVKEPPAP